MKKRKAEEDAARDAAIEADREREAEAERRAEDLRERLLEMAEKDAERKKAREEWKAKRAAEAAEVAAALNARIAIAREKDAAVITNRRAEYAAKLEAVRLRNEEKAEREKDQRALLDAAVMCSASLPRLTPSTPFTHSR